MSESFGPPGVERPSLIARSSWHIGNLIGRRFNAQPRVPGIPEWIGDIPGTIFVPGIHGWERTRNGSWIYCNTEPAYAELEFPTAIRGNIWSNDIHFVAFMEDLDREGYTDSKSAISFSCRSRLPGSEQRYLRMRELFAAGIKYLEHHNGPVDYIKATWEPGSDNRAQFEQTLRGFGDKGFAYNEQALRLAGESTWTAQRAAANGFDQTIEVWKDGRNVHALFGRSQPLQYDAPHPQFVQQAA